MSAKDLGHRARLDKIDGLGQIPGDTIPQTMADRGRFDLPEADFGPGTGSAGMLGNADSVAHAVWREKDPKNRQRPTNAIEIVLTYRVVAALI